MRDDVRIPSRGEELAAYVYRPDATGGDAPCVVMAHGFSATRDDGLPGYAEAFRDAGFVVVLFDYRHFGASTGEPRQLLDIARQHDDYRAVIGWARGLDGVDPERIVVWGSSFSGGHVLAIAAAGDPGTVAAMTAPEANPGFAALVGPNSKWRNEFAARLMLTFGFYRPGLKTKRLKMPLLMCVCDNDATTPVAPAVRPPNGHRGPNSATTRTVIFDIYHDP